MPVDLSKEFEIIKKPLRFKCIQFTGLNHNELKEFCSKYLFYDKDKTLLLSRKGRVKIEGSDYIIKDDLDHCTLCTAKEFEQIYDVIQPPEVLSAEEVILSAEEVIEPKESKGKARAKAKDQVSAE